MRTQKHSSPHGINTCWLYKRLTSWALRNVSAADVAAVFFSPSMMDRVLNRTMYSAQQCHNWRTRPKSHQDAAAANTSHNNTSESRFISATNTRNALHAAFACVQRQKTVSFRCMVSIDHRAHLKPAATERQHTFSAPSRLTPNRIRAERFCCACS